MLPGLPVISLLGLKIRFRLFWTLGSYPVGSMGGSCLPVCGSEAGLGQGIKAWLLRFSGPKGPPHQCPGRIRGASQDLSSRHGVPTSCCPTHKRSVPGHPSHGSMNEEVTQCPGECTHGSHIYIHSKCTPSTSKLTHSHTHSLTSSCRCGVGT